MHRSRFPSHVQKSTSDVRQLLFTLINQRVASFRVAGTGFAFSREFQIRIGRIERAPCASARAVYASTAFLWQSVSMAGVEVVSTKQVSVERVLRGDVSF